MCIRDRDETALYGAKMMQPVVTAADSEENNLRPQHLEDYIGQEKVKQNLKIYLEAAKRRGEPVDHILLYGPPGLGKTTLAGIIANEMGVQIRITSGDVYKRQGLDRAEIMAKSFEVDLGPDMFFKGLGLHHDSSFFAVCIKLPRPV